MTNAICYELLTKGVYSIGKNDGIIDMSQINKNFRDLNCVVRYWYDKSALILINNNDMQIGKTESERKDVEWYKKIICNEQIANYDRKSKHIENGWVYEQNNKIHLTKKFLMQYADFVMETNKDYKMCRICDILVYEKEEHEYCTAKKQELLRKEKMNNK